MLLDGLRSVGGPLLAAILGGLLVHFATRRRDAENERRRQRVDYLISAYRTLTHTAQRELSPERATAFEDALSDVVLFGNAEQIRLAGNTIESLAKGGEAPVDDLLVSFRTALRRELDLSSDNLSLVPLVRFRTADARHHTPLKAQQTWEVSVARTEAALALAAPVSNRDADRTLASAELKQQVQGLRELAQAAPGAAVVAGYGQVAAALKTVLDADYSDGRDAPELARDAADRGFVTTQLVETVDGLAVLKDLSRRDGGRTDLTVEQASDYIDLVAAALYVLASARPAPKRHECGADGQHPRPLLVADPRS
jgi:hypothetical protein